MEILQTKKGSKAMKKCPRCGKNEDRLLALSRRDNKTSVCESCGSMEAINDAEPYPAISKIRILDEMIWHKKLGLNFQEWIDWKKSILKENMLHGV